MITITSAPFRRSFSEKRKLMSFLIVITETCIHMWDRRKSYEKRRLRGWWSKLWPLFYIVMKTEWFCEISSFENLSSKIKKGKNTYSNKSKIMCLLLWNWSIKYHRISHFVRYVWKFQLYYLMYYIFLPLSPIPKTKSQFDLRILIVKMSSKLIWIFISQRS